MRLLLILLVLQFLDLTVLARRQLRVHWNTTNPIFRIDNTEHVMDVMLQDQVHIVCPRGQNDEQYVIYDVNKEEFDNCRISNPHPRRVAVCDNPERDMIYSITFRSFSPSPTMMEFQPGKDYYFITTSSPENLMGKLGGRCRTHNMKIVFKVKERLETSKSKFKWMNRKINGRRKQVTTTTRRPIIDNSASFSRGRYDTTGMNQSFKKSVDKKSIENEVIKQEASRMQSSSATSWLSANLVLFACTLFVSSA